MEDEFERLKYVLDMYEEDEDKIAFLLRQVEWLIKEKDNYKAVVLKRRCDKQLLTD